ncbi:MAG TPA: triose-phosphate isomerase [Bacteroidetes bacterium]|nr:triose-phosphate isomerase [Bacteroidota bacterium]
MRKKIAAGNWKMNKNYNEAIDLATSISNSINIPEDVTVILGVPYIYLKEINEISGKNPNVFVSSQNVHQKDHGAYTGEISAPMLKSINIPYVIIGHSERREYYCETPEILKEKVEIALDNDLNVIFCCGEPLEIRQKNKHEEYVKDQIEKSISHLSSDKMGKITIAYEPIWAIGTGETATPQQAQEMHKFIRGYISELFGEKVAEERAILYGGSVKPSNAVEIFGQDDVDGGLVGGASMEVKSFLEIINSFE